MFNTEDFLTGISSLLATSIPSLVVGTNLFAVNLPSSPNGCCAVRMTGGPFNAANPTGTKTFQILYRDSFTDTGVKLIDSIVEVLKTQWNLMCGYPGRIYLNHEPGQYFKDANLMYIWSLNYTYQLVQR